MYALVCMNEWKYLLMIWISDTAMFLNRAGDKIPEAKLVDHLLTCCDVLNIYIFLLFKVSTHHLLFQKEKR